jgi:hypothetical protein
VPAWRSTTKKTILELNGRMLNGRAITVELAIRMLDGSLAGRNPGLGRRAPQERVRAEGGRWRAFGTPMFLREWPGHKPALHAVQLWVRP